MSSSSSRYWSEIMVMSYLQSAAAIHRRLPAVKAPGYHSYWPTTLKDDWQRLHDAVNGKPRLGSPMPPEVTFHEEIMEWLRLLGRKQQQILWMRANRIPWKILTNELERGKTMLWHEMKNALTQIATWLNEKDPEGQYYRRLQKRSNSVFEHL